MAIKIDSITFDKQALDKIPKRERELFLLFGHIRDELNIFRRFLLWNIALDSHNLIEQRAQMMQALTIGKIFAGKLFEAWEATRKYFLRSTISREYNSILGGDATASLQKLKDYFGQGKNQIRTVRDMFGFHYVMDGLAKGYDATNDPSELTIYLSAASPNTLYYLSEVVVNYGLISQLHGETLQSSLDGLFSEMTDVSQCFDQFILGYMMAFVDRNSFSSDDFIASESQMLEPEVEYEGHLIPYFSQPRRQ